MESSVKEEKSDSGLSVGPDGLEGPSPSSHFIGLLSGLIWNYLNLNGKTSVIQLKSELLCSATHLHLALGWLLREDKIEFSKEKGHLLVQLKN